MFRNISKKPIYDIPGFPEILAGDLTTNLLEQCKQFEPGFTLGERAEKLKKMKIIFLLLPLIKALNIKLL